LPKIASEITLMGSLSSQDGRAISIKFEWHNTVWIVSSICAPNNPAQRRNYFKHLDLNGLALPDRAENLIVGGDWNCIDDPTLDKRGGNPQEGTTDASELREFRTRHQLEDFWRRRNPQQPVHTWSRGDIHCRLDRIFTSKPARSYIHNFEHLTCPLSDH